MWLPVNLCCVLGVLGTLVRVTFAENCTVPTKDYQWNNFHVISKNQSQEFKIDFALPFKINCNFNITYANGKLLPEKDYLYKKGNTSDEVYLLHVKKIMQGKFYFKFEDGSEKHLYFYCDHKQFCQSSFGTNMEETWNQTIENPTLPRQVNWLLDNETKFYHCIESKCHNSTQNQLNLTDNETTQVNCQNKSLTVFLNESLHQDNMYEWNETCQNKDIPHMESSNTQLNLRLFSTLKKKSWEQTASISKTLFNYYPTTVSFNLDQDASNFSRCVQLHGCFVEEGFQAKCDAQTNTLMFKNTLVGEMNVTVHCHKDIPWTLKIKIDVMDSSLLSIIILCELFSTFAIAILFMYLFSCLGILATIITATFLICLARYIYTHHISTKYDNVSNDFDSNDFNLEMIQNRTESCSDDEEETYTNLENEFGNMLEKVLKPWSAVTMGEEIGNGSFGKVYHGYLDVGEFTRVEVAIKESSNSNDRTDLIHEGKYVLKK